MQVDMQEPDAARARTFHIRIKYAAAVNPRELVQFAEYAPAPAFPAQSKCYSLSKKRY